METVWDLLHLCLYLPGHCDTQAPTLEEEMETLEEVYEVVYFVLLPDQRPSCGHIVLGLITK